MWCNHCHYGSDVFTGITRVISRFGINGPEPRIINPPKCPMCSVGRVVVPKRPFPNHPTRMGKGGVSQAIKKLNKDVDNCRQILTREELLTQMEANHAVLAARGEVA